MKKQRKQSGEFVAWSVYILRSKLSWIGSVEARDEKEAIDRAIEKLGVREADRFRISVRRE
jgi:hypothetical protein